MSAPGSFRTFDLERWQSTHENRVDFNLSESGVHPLTVRELLALAGMDGIDDVALGYGETNGSEVLRSRIALLYPDALADQVLVANGSAEANFASMWALADDDATIAVVVPTYMQMHGLASIFGARVLEIPLRAELGWQPDPDEAAAVIRSGVRAVVVTNPNNPTGAVLGPDARRAIIDAASAVNAWIVADEVYAGAELEGPPTASFFGMYPRTIATGSLSKAYGLPGLRIGWSISPPEMTERLWARRDYTTIAPGTVTDRLACIALDPAVRPRLLERTRAHIRAGLDVIEPWLAAQKVFRWRTPAAGAICLAHYDLPIDSAPFAERMRAELSTLIVPGSQFGIEHAVRFGIGGPAADLRAALGRMAGMIDTLKTRPAG